MSIFKMTTDEQGQIEGIQEIFVGDYDAAGIGGYVVEDKILAQEILSDLDNARATKWYDIDNDVIFDRPILPIKPNKLELQSDDEDTIIINGLPIPCTVTVDDAVYQMDDPEDTTFEWSTPMSGTYVIRINAWPYQEWTREVTAT